MISLYRALSIASQALVAAIFCLIIADVLTRAIFSSSLFFANSSVEYSQLYFTALIAPVLAHRGEHVSVDLLGRMLPAPAFVILSRIAAFLSAIVCLAFSLSAVWLCVEAIKSGQTDIRGITVPMWVIYMPLVICFLLLGLEYLVQAIRGRKNP